MLESDTLTPTTRRRLGRCSGTRGAAGEHDRGEGGGQCAAGAHLFLFVIFCVTYAETSVICFGVSWPLKAGMPPPPFSTCETTLFWFFALGIDVRSGPPLPPWPLAPWQETQLSAKTVLPAAASPAPVDVFFGVFSPACCVP